MVVLGVADCEGTCEDGVGCWEDGGRSMAAGGGGGGGCEDESDVDAIASFSVFLRWLVIDNYSRQYVLRERVGQPTTRFANTAPAVGA